MRKPTAVIASVAWFAVTGGVGAVLVPWWLTGDALLFGQLSVLLYALAAWAGSAVFVRWYEEPVLARRFGPDYVAYRRAVPAWLPLLHPWSPNK